MRRRTVLRDVFDEPAPPPRAFARYGTGSWLVPPCTIAGADAIAIGDGVIVLEHANFRVLGDAADGPRLVLHDGVRLTRLASIVCEVSIILEERVASSDCVTIVDTWRDSDWPHAGELPDPGPVHIERGAYLGFGCTIGPGVRVGEGAFVGEGAIVLEDVAAHSVVYGNPARVVRRYDADSSTWQGRRWP